jgi:L-lactate dehydrogenase complex protein LldG
MEPEEKNMTNREIILGRIREALKSPEAVHEVPVAPPSSFKQWLPPVGDSPEEQMDLFRSNVEDLRADFKLCASLDEAIRCLQAMAVEYDWKKIGLHRGVLTETVARGLDLVKVMTDEGYVLADLESCDAGLTGCDALIAQTGSVLVSSTTSGGRALSVLPPHHIVLARENQLVPDLTVALERAQEKYGDQYPSFLSLITGPSRTGDIERILVLGAHGPKRLTILLVR